MGHKFLSEGWFTAYDAASEGVEVPASVAEVAADLKVQKADGGVIEARIEKGFLRRGFGTTSIATIAAPEDVIYQALVLGDIQAALRGMLGGKMKVEGNKAALIKIGMAAQTPSQKAMTEKLKAFTDA